MSEYITTHEELLKLDGKHVCCAADGVFVEDGIILVEDSWVFVCQDKIGGEYGNNKGKKFRSLVSAPTARYEEENHGWKEIRLLEKTKDSKTTPAVIENAVDVWKEFLKTLEEIKTKGSEIKTTKALETLTKKLKEL